MRGGARKGAGRHTLSVNDARAQVLLEAEKKWVVLEEKTGLRCFFPRKDWLGLLGPAELTVEECGSLETILEVLASDRWKDPRADEEARRAVANLHRVVYRRLRNL